MDLSRHRQADHLVPAPLKTPYEEAKEKEAKAKLARGADQPPSRWTSADVGQAVRLCSGPAEDAVRGGEGKGRQGKAGTWRDQPPAGENQPPIKPYVFVPAPLKTPYEEAKERKEAKELLCRYVRAVPIGLLRTYCL